MTRVEFSERAADWYQKAEPDVQDQINSRLEQAVDFPDHFLSQLRGSPYYKLRAGDYRLIIDWNRNEDVLFVRRAGHRDGFYD